MPLMLWMPRSVPLPRWTTHDDLAALIELLPTTTAERGGLRRRFGDSTSPKAAQWREMGTYPGDFAPEVVAGRSTPGHAATMANAAARLTCVWLDVASAGGFNPHVRVLGMGGCDGRRCVVGGLGRGRRVGRLGWCLLRRGVLGRG